MNEQFTKYCLGFQELRFKEPEVEVEPEIDEEMELEVEEEGLIPEHDYNNTTCVSFVQ